MATEEHSVTQLGKQNCHHQTIHTAANAHKPLLMVQKLLSGLAHVILTTSMHMSKGVIVMHEGPPVTVISNLVAPHAPFT